MVGFETKRVNEKSASVSKKDREEEIEPKLTLTTASESPISVEGSEPSTKSIPVENLGLMECLTTVEIHSESTERKIEKQVSERRL